MSRNTILIRKYILEIQNNLDEVEEHLKLGGEVPADWDDQLKQIISKLGKITSKAQPEP